MLGPFMAQKRLIGGRVFLAHAHLPSPQLSKSKHPASLDLQQRHKTLRLFP
jgi:hypothetical protein